MNIAAFEESEATSPVKAGRQEIRTRETRDLLLRAAKTIFIRDGYEGADLNDIAELAGRSKGAIYGHFKGKEEIFLALIEYHRKEYRQKVEKLLSTSDVKQNIAVIRRFVVNLVEDDDWALLQLEFKMFALRHPETKKHIRSFYEPLTSDREEVYTKLLGPAGKSKRSVSRAMALHSIIPMLSALLLEAEFDQVGLLSKDSIKRLIAGVFDCLIGE